MLALVRVAGGREHLIHVRAKRSEARSRFRSRGFGRLRRYELTQANDPQARTIYGSSACASKKPRRQAGRNAIQIAQAFHQPRNRDLRTRSLL